MNTMKSQLQKFSLLFLFPVLCVAMANAQTKASFMYNEKYQFRTDTSLTVARALCETWSYAERNIAAILSDTKIPEENVQSGLRCKHPIIVSFECDSADISHIKFVNDTSSYGRAAAESLKKHGKKIAEQLRSKSSLTQEKKFLGKYYIAFNFLLLNFNDQFRNQKAIPVVGTTNPYRETDLE